MRQNVIRCGLVLAALVVLGAEKKEDKPPVYQSPEKVFDAFVAADARGDFETLVGCLAPDALKVLTLELILHGRGMRAYVVGATRDKGERRASEEEAKVLRPLVDVMDKHGLTVKATQEFQVNSGTMEQRLKARHQLLAAVKDAPRFCVDYATALRKSRQYSRFAPRKDLGAKLANVKIDGDKATGDAVVTDQLKSGKTSESKSPIAFVKGDNGWRVIHNPEKKLDGKYFDPFNTYVKR